MSAQAASPARRLRIWPLIVSAMLVALIAPRSAGAWGREGHAIVAAIADAHLTSRTRQEVDRLLALEPGSTLESIASWADEHRSGGTAKWHYTNYPAGDCHYQPARDCHHGQCLVHALETQARVLGDSSRPDEERLRALKLVVHLTGDGEQPLHNWGPDRGGNTYQVRYDGRGTNVHSLWDSGLIRYAATPSGVLNALLSGGKPNYRVYRQSMVDRSMQARRSSSIDPVAWTEQACRLANAPGIYPGRYVTDAYMRHWQPVMESQLVEAGMHLAALLNSELGGR